MDGTDATLHDRWQQRDQCSAGVNGIVSKQHVKEGIALQKEHSFIS